MDQNSIMALNNQLKNLFHQDDRDNIYYKKSLVNNGRMMWYYTPMGYYRGEDDRGPYITAAKAAEIRGEVMHSTPKADRDDAELFVDSVKRPRGGRRRRRNSKKVKKTRKKTRRKKTIRKNKKGKKTRTTKR